MIGQHLLSIQEPCSDTDWFVLNTEQHSYELRLGGSKETKTQSKGPIIDLKFDKPKIMRVLTDNFAVYIELDNGFGILHSDTFIDANGDTSFEIHIKDSNYYQNDGGLEGMLPITNFD